MTRFCTPLRVLTAAAAIAVLPPGASADETRGITDTTIRIGNIGPFTGEASLFSPLNYGPEAYFRYINDQGGVHGRKFETVFSDTACNEAKGIAAAKKVIHEDEVFMIAANPCSGVAMAIKPTLLQEKVPWMGVSANPKITRPTVEHMFHVTYTGIESGNNMARFAMSKPEVDQIAIVAHTNDWARGYCDPATEYVEENGGEVVLDIAMERGSTDASAQVLQIKSQGAEAVLGCVYQPELVILLREMHKFGVDVPVVGALGADFNQVVQQVNNMDAVQQKFFQPYQFQARIGTGPLEKFHDIFVEYLTEDELPEDGVPTNFYYFGVPVAIATVEAFRRAGPEPTREKWIEAMESLRDFETGVLADTVTITPDDHVGVERMYAVGLDENGEETVYKSWGEPLEASE